MNPELVSVPLDRCKVCGGEVRLLRDEHGYSVVHACPGTDPTRTRGIENEASVEGAVQKWVEGAVQKWKEMNQ